jgi:hypothetical protein
MEPHAAGLIQDVQLVARATLTHSEIERLQPVFGHLREARNVHLDCIELQEPLSSLRVVEHAQFSGIAVILRNEPFNPVAIAFDDFGSLRYGVPVLDGDDDKDEIEVEIVLLA